MNILIVHDRAEIREEIAEIASSSGGDVQVDLADDGVSARGMLAENYFDMLVMDLTIPNINGRGEIGFQVAESLLDELFSLDTMMRPGSVLGITKDPGALDRIQTNIGPHLMAIVGEDIDGLWRKNLRDRIAYVRDSARSRQTALMTRHDYDVLILTALDKELAPLSEFVELNEIRQLPGVSEFIFADAEGRTRRGACSAIGRAGQPSAASETQGLLCQLRPKLALMTGFCGGVPGKAGLGDVLFAELAIDWDYGKWKPSAEASRLYARPEPISIRNTAAHRISRRLVQNGVADPTNFEIALRGRSAGEIGSPRFLLSPVASGSAVIADAEVLDGVKALNEDVGGVDMESFGFYYACRYPKSAKPEFLCIKAVADDCGTTKDDRLHDACCYASTYVAYEIITKLWDFSS